MFDEAEIVSCPICTLPLSRDGMALVCANRHSFDVAREGYVNLVRKPLPADNNEMLNARRAFLEEGHYRPLLELLGEQAIAHGGRWMDSASELHMLDAGCGEGYYLGRMQDVLAQKMKTTQPATERSGMTMSSVGIDLSKEAVRMAARRYKESLFVVANLKERLPLQDGCMHVVLNIFAPRNVEEYSRVLMPGGLMLIAIPGPQHLQPLREQLGLLNVEEEKQQHVLRQFAIHFLPIGVYPLSYEVVFTEEQIRQIVTMTPNYWHQRSGEPVYKGIAATRTVVNFEVIVLERI